MRKQFGTRAIQAARERGEEDTLATMCGIDQDFSSPQCSVSEADEVLFRALRQVKVKFEFVISREREKEREEEEEEEEEEEQAVGERDQRGQRDGRESSRRERERAEREEGWRRTE